MLKQSLGSLTCHTTPAIESFGKRSNARTGRGSGKSSVAALVILTDELAKFAHGQPSTNETNVTDDEAR